ncbi:MAG: hypothetical protein BWY56_00911 [Acidobacteria bacterium ADurb.Bin340]|nr:MAG: hypothetical protein BWY56_00911 [Acidobacteria bacterium ADurb.Bin340]HOD33390.1 hypothetical protein [Holophaga sp.]
MTRTLSSQRGEGKIGCIVSLLVLVVLGAVAFKVVPVVFSNQEFVRSAEEIAGRAATLSQDNITLQIQKRAQDLEIMEALEPGAVTVVKSGGGQGTCRLSLNYVRKVDLFGITTIDIKTNKEKAIPFADYR